ncbi:glycosyltransferase family 4 protein [Terriglobus albidus]|uniref:Glycosyltransferase family 4 protein n=1 Tax=Terriglobus albidus TaxID=1592106 RepID=A0A5B9EEA6_9BACT|nr:glycosyltransferase family 4 protein [Terriglobus albidus]QEE28386.1 glycosyltransferase family 4 protein [Terriglobus albidus]
MRPSEKTILLVSVATLYGGAEAYYVKLAKILQLQFKVVAVVCCERLRDELVGHGIDTVLAEIGTRWIGPRRYLTAFAACRKMKAHYAPRVAHLNGQPESYLALFLRLLGMRLLTTRHTPFTDLYLREGSRLPVFFKRFMVLFSLRLCHATVCVSKLLQEQLGQYLASSKLVYLPTWVSDKFLERGIRPMPSDPLKVLFVGRVVRNKGIFTAIETARRCPWLQLTVVGDGDDLPVAREKARGLNVFFAGFQRDCRPMYRAADLFLFPSPEGFEGLPQVLLEAMAQELPCLAADIHSVLEIAGPDGVVATYKQGDGDALVAQLEKFRRDPQRLLELGQAGRLEVERHYTVASVASGYLQIFNLAFL